MSLVIVLGLGLIGGLVNDLLNWLLLGVIGGLFVMLLSGLGGGLLGGLQEIKVSTTQVPNQAIHRSFQSGIISGVSLWLGIMLVGGLVGGMLGRLDFGLRLGLGDRLVGGAIYSGLGFGLAGGLGFGLIAVIQHYSLRIALWREGVIPLNYVRFLCQCHDALLLQRDGGIFRFRHPLLQDYFADLWEGAEEPVPANTPATRP